MSSNFKKFMRKLRVDCGENLADMAKKLNFTASFLSNIENGVRKIPCNFTDKLISIYDLSEDLVSELKTSIAMDNNRIVIDLDNLDETSRRAALLINTTLAKLTKEECQRIIDLCISKK